MSDKTTTELNENAKEESEFLSIQEILSMGYILLIIVGMFLEYVKYNVFGINIIEHSDFADFMIAPFKNPSLVGIPIIGGFLILVLDYYYKKRKFQKKKILDEENNLSPKASSIEATKSTNYQAYIIWFISMFICFNIGFGISGYFTNHYKMERNLNSEITNAKIKFIDGTNKEVYLLGKNTSNLFYFENNKIDLIVCPIPGNVKTIKYIPKEQQKKIKKD